MGARGSAKTGQGLARFITLAMLAGDLKSRTIVGNISFEHGLENYLLGQKAYKTFLDDFLHLFLLANRKSAKAKIQEPSTVKEGDLVAFKTKESPFSQINTSFRFGRVHSLLQRPHSLDGTSRSVYVSYFNQPGDLREDGQEYEKTGKEVVTLRRIDSLIALDSDENLQKEFEKQSKYLQQIYNKDHTTTKTVDNVENPKEDGTPETNKVAPVEIPKEDDTPETNKAKPVENPKED